MARLLNKFILATDPQGRTQTERGNGIWNWASGPLGPMPTPRLEGGIREAFDRWRLEVGGRIAGKVRKNRGQANYV